MRGIATLVVLPGLLAAASFPGPLSAMETASMRINHITLEEAKALARTWLSPAGRLSALPSRSLLIVIDEEKNIAKIRGLIRQFDVAVPTVHLNLQILSVSISQSRLWAKEGRQLPGGWRLIADAASIRRQLMAKKEVWFHAGAGIKVEAGAVRPIRQNIRHWLEQHGVPDTPGLMLHPIAIGFTLQGRLQNNGQIRLRLSPWLRLTYPPRITARGPIEILPDLGSTNATKQPPSTTASMRLNIQPEAHAGFQHYISIAGSNTVINISAGQPVMLLASREEARALGDALLSKTINTQEKRIVFRLLLERIF